ncbi:MAG: patatin-like phospholipase family protein, partial [Burkholderiales bacterium]|nr:patatin-like phospholipase family protein [Burkholderiales bacterium]
MLQGGGALGAYQAGVYEALAEAGHTPTWVVGVSIGSINTALIAGNPPEKRVERLRAFWERVSSYAPFAFPPAFEPMREAFNKISAATVATFGSPGFFTPRMPPPSMAMDGTLEATSYCDTSPLKDTLEELVDFDRINSRQVRVSLGAVNVRTSASVYFDNQKIRIRPEHVMASGALPPGFPAVEIDGEHYWDGGIVSNSPLNYVWDEKPLTTALIVMVDLFNAKGELPRNLDEVGERQKDVQYATKQRFTNERAKELGELRQALKVLLAKLPANLKDGPEARKLATLCDDRQWLIARVTNPRLPHGSQTKDYEFSRATVEERWAAGLRDVRQAIEARKWLEPD